MDKVIAQILSFLERVLPTFLGGYFLGKKSSADEVSKLDADLRRAQYELEKSKNDKAVEENNRGKSSNDIVADAIRKGRNVQ